MFSSINFVTNYWLYREIVQNASVADFFAEALCVREDVFGMFFSVSAKNTGRRRSRAGTCKHGSAADQRSSKSRSNSLENRSSPRYGRSSLRSCLRTQNSQRFAGRNENLSDEDLRAVEHLQSQFRDCERFYTKETERLNEKLRSMSKELEQQRSRHDKIITEVILSPFSCILGLCGYTTKS